MKKCAIVTAFLAAPCFLGACQNSLRVDVELIQPRQNVNQSQAQDDSTITAGSTVTPMGVTGISSSPLVTRQVTSRGRLRFVEGVLAVRAAVDGVLDRITSIKQALLDAKYTETALNGPQFAGVNTLGSDVTLIKNDLASLETLLPYQYAITIENMQALKGIQLRVQAALSQGMEALARLEARIADRISSSADDSAAKKQNDDTQRAINEIEDLVAFGAAAKAAVAASGFGGFQSVGVHQISPADPAYRDVLSQARSETVGTFTTVQAAVNGDSTIVFVQENPTQLRVFEIDNDPTQLLQNFAYITDKALEAAVKYAQP